MIVDLNLRFQVYSLMEELTSRQQPGVEEMIPGVRSLLIKYDGLKISLKELVKLLINVEEHITPVDDFILPSWIACVRFCWNGYRH